MENTEIKDTIQFDEERARAEGVVGTIDFYIGQGKLGERVVYTDKDDYLKAIKQELDVNPSGFKHHTLTSDPAVRKAVKDLIYDFFGGEESIQLLNHTFTAEEKSRLMSGEVITLNHLKTKDGRDIPSVRLARNPQTGKLTRVKSSQQERTMPTKLSRHHKTVQKADQSSAKKPASRKL